MTSTLPATFETDDACAAEQDLRVQLAAAYRIFDHLGWCELIYGHISMRVPGPEHHFLINPYGLRYDEIARALDISVSAAKVKVHRARLKLARLMDEGTSKRKERSLP